MPEILKTTWGAVAHGSMLAKGGDEWEVIAVADAHEGGMTPWLRIKRASDGAEASVAPKGIREPVEVAIPTKEEYAQLVGLIKSGLGAEPIKHEDFSTGATWFQKVDNMTQLELANHINSHHNSAAPLTMSLDKLSELHARLHSEAGHGASHHHL